jgi:hypothetical protein
VGEHLEIKALLAFILHLDGCLQLILAKPHAVDERKAVGPGLLAFSADVRMREAKVQRDAVIGDVLVQELPARDPGEAVLRES